MNIMKYLVIGGLIAVSGTAFCAELPKSQEFSVLSSEQQEKLTKGLHESRTKEEAEEWIKKGAQMGMLLVVDTAGDRNKTYRTFLCSAVLNPLASEELVEFVVSRRGLPPFGETQINRGERSVPQATNPLFRKLISPSIMCSEGLWNSLDLLQKKCTKLVECGERLDRHYETKESGALKLKYKGDTFAELSRDNFYEQYDEVQRFDESVCKPRLMYTLVMCKSIHTAGARRSFDIKQLLSEALPKFSLDLINRIVFEYISLDDAELQKIKAILDDPRAKPFLQELPALEDKTEITGIV